MSHRRHPVTGAGLGLRRALLGPLHHHAMEPVDFMEVVPENWINVGGKLRNSFRHFADRFPLVAHGLSLSIGGPAPLDETFIRKVQCFLDDNDIRFYTEHLSYCTDDGHLYDLMPIPFTEEAVTHVSARIRRTQEILGRRIAMENVSYYAAPGAQLSEIEFINAVLEEADCDLLLDLNNIHVNSINHRYDAVEYLRALPGERIVYGHIAGHSNVAQDLIIDTHGAEVIPDVWSLLDKAYEFFGVFPTLLERDFNFPPVEELMAEVTRIQQIQALWNKLEQERHEQGNRQRA